MLHQTHSLEYLTWHTSFTYVLIACFKWRNTFRWRWVMCKQPCCFLRVHGWADTMLTWWGAVRLFLRWRIPKFHPLIANRWTMSWHIWGTRMDWWISYNHMHCIMAGDFEFLWWRIDTLQMPIGLFLFWFLHLTLRWGGLVTRLFGMKSAMVCGYMVVILHITHTLTQLE